MNVEQAIEFLDNVVSKVAMNRDEHVRAQQALNMLRAATTKPADINEEPEVPQDDASA